MVTRGSHGITAVEFTNPFVYLHWDEYLRSVNNVSKSPRAFVIKSGWSNVFLAQELLRPDCGKTHLHEAAIGQLRLCTTSRSCKNRVAKKKGGAGYLSQRDVVGGRCTTEYELETCSLQNDCEVNKAVLLVLSLVRKNAKEFFGRSKSWWNSYRMELKSSI